MTDQPEEQEEPETKTVSAGDTEHMMVTFLVSQMAEHAKAMMPKDPDLIVQFQSRMMTAAAMYAGTILGQMIVVGIASEKDKRRYTDVMARNFRSGIVAGKNQAMRVAFDLMNPGQA